ncbi:MAG: hypothetical protein M3N24_02395 [Actinomycetota bacterium]|nr:hypothetical protein [Actinomycetota bacterium]
MAEDRKYRYQFSILGRYPARMKGNESAVTVNMATGYDDHLAFAGTLTMTEDEWKTLVDALKYSLRDGVEVVDMAPPPGEAKKRVK